MLCLKFTTITNKFMVPLHLKDKALKIEILGLN